MWWDHQVVLPKLAAALRQRTVQGRKLFLAVANTLPTGRDTTRIRQDTAGVTRHMRAELALVDLLRRQAPTAVAWDWKYYPDEGHGSVPLRAEYDALHYFFRHQDVPLPTSVNDPTFTAESMQRQYQTLSQQFGYPVYPPEELVNLYAWGCMSKKLGEKACRLFQLNLANYPQSFNAHSSMGTFYEQQGNKKQALYHYAQALQLQNRPELRQKILELRARK